jgi:hypothetical protein
VSGVDYTLKKGAHKSREAGMCAMEWVSYIAGEPHSDQPRCVSPVLKSFCVAFNDALPDDRRQRLRPYLTRCIGTAGDGRDEARAWMATDWLVTVYAPAWLDLAGLHAHAQNLRALGRSITDATAARSAMPTIEEARKAGATAWAAAGDAARAAARDAARAAAGAAAGAAAWAAAGAAAWAAAGDAAGAAERAWQVNRLRQYLNGEVTR